MSKLDTMKRVRNLLGVTAALIAALFAPELSSSSAVNAVLLGLSAATVALSIIRLNVLRDTPAFRRDLFHVAAWSALTGIILQRCLQLWF